MNSKENKAKQEIEKIIEDSKIISQELEDHILRNDRKQLELEKDIKSVKYFVIITLTMAFLTIVYVLFSKSYGRYIQYVLIAFYSLTLGIYFWLLRERFRLIYALIELSVGLATILIVLSTNDFNFEFGNWKFQNYMGIVGGLYILVRGIDNFTKTNFGSFLLDFFYLKK
ncbi:hypothetical protein [Flavobacterium branchiicola]|uniref:Uncharacterized protein n=1 Tax=Flavobacterium branchiicola TaxID=1114875 RepID=A0ABV9PHM2_9FLAO|nr:hypothetical protein [Flavobacterium branchiicola]MBS7255856.1 hypothetical protein [Flavobacterium branchiicola]